MSAVSLPFLFWILFHNNMTEFSLSYYGVSFVLSAIFVYFFLRAIILNPQDKILELGYDDAAIKILFKYTLIALACYLVFNTFILAPTKIGLPAGHARDFFQLIDEAKQNDYGAVTQVGYLPALLSVAKMISVFFYQIDSQLIPNFWDWCLYFVIMFSCLYFILKPIFKFSWSKVGAPLTFVFFISYPYMLELERGNWVIFSTLLLSLAVTNSDPKKYSGILAFFTNFKILNLPFLPIFFLQKKFQVRPYLLGFLFFGALIPVIILTATQGLISYSSLISKAGASGAFPDAHIAVAHSGLYALLVLFQDSGLLQSISAPWVAKSSMHILCVLLVLYYFLEFYLRFIKKQNFSKVDLCFGFIAIFALTKLFHYNNADYNYVLLFPFILPLFFEKLNLIERTIFACVLLFLFPFYIFNLFSIANDEVGQIYNHYFTARTFVFSSNLCVLVILSYTRILMRFKNDALPFNFKLKEVGEL